MDEEQYTYDCDDECSGDSEEPEEEYLYADEADYEHEYTYEEDQYADNEEAYEEYDYEAAYGDGEYDGEYEEEDYCESTAANTGENVETEEPPTPSPVDESYGLNEAYPEMEAEEPPAPSPVDESYGFNEAYPEYEEDAECEYELDFCEYEADLYETNDTSEGECELFSWMPSDLLTWDDEDVLRALQSLGEEPLGLRQALLNDYVGGLGWETVGFLIRFEGMTGIEVLGLADNVASAAAMLGTLRLIEQSELDIEDGLIVLDEALEDLSQAWIDEVTEVTCEAPEELEDSAPGWTVVNVVLDLTADSLNGAGEAFCSMSRRISSLKH